MSAKAASGARRSNTPVIHHLFQAFQATLRPSRTYSRGPKFLPVQWWRLRPINGPLMPASLGMHLVGRNIHGAVHDLARGAQKGSLADNRPSCLILPQRDFDLDRAAWVGDTESAALNGLRPSQRLHCRARQSRRDPSRDRAGAPIGFGESTEGKAAGHEIAFVRSPRYVVAERAPVLRS